MIYAIPIVLFAAFLLMVALRPAEFRVTRGASIKAPAQSVFAMVNDFRAWESWSPWEKLDPAMKHEYSGPPSGVGAVHAWSGNAKAGQGRATIVASRPCERIAIKLEFIKPWTCVNEVEFAFKPEGERVAVTWTMTGKNNFMLKAFGLFMDMDKMVGGDFEKGLSAMQALAERGGGGGSPQA